MFNRYLIIDDFYSNPDEIVDTALKSPKEEAQPVDHEPGLLTTNFFLGQPLRELFQKLTLETSIVSSDSANGRILFTQAQENSAFRVHYDPKMHTKWTGVIYLSREDPGVDGTCFWRHKRTGLEIAPNTVEGFAEYGWKNFSDLRAFLETEGLDESLWEKTLSIPYKYNRLVLFRPWLLHSPGPAFGDSLDNSRIIQTIFLGN